MADEIRPTLVPYMLVRGASDAIAFYARVFGAEESGARFTDPEGRIGHAEIRIGNSNIMLADEHPEAGFVFSPFMFYLVVADADAAVARALEAGSKLLRPVEEQPYGERSGTVEDPFGHRWMLNQPLESLTREQLQERVGKDYEIS